MQRQRIDLALKQGDSLLRSGRFREAEASYQAALHMDPTNADANNGMGTLAIKAKLPQVATGYFEKAHKASPNDRRYRNNLANALTIAGEAESAIAHYVALLQESPDFYEALCGIGRAYIRLGHAQQAEPYLRAALALRPSDAAAVILLAEVLANLGKTLEAEAMYRRAQRKGASPASVLYGLATCQKQTPENNVLAAVESALKKASPGDATTTLAYAAAKTCIDLNRAGQAMDYLQQAKKDRQSFDVSAHSRRIDSTIQIFGRYFLEQRKSYGSPSERPVFIVGMPRSGTSLTEQILASHPAITGAGELPHIFNIANDLLYSADLELFAKKLNGIDPFEVKQLSNAYLAKLNWHSRTETRVIDKMPHNFMLLGLIALLFPNARVIHCKRDPSDNCLSVYTNMFSEGHAYSNDLGQLGRYYRDYVRLMAHWREVLPLRMLDVQYEEMVADQEAQSRRLVNFVGLDWDPACLNFHQAERAVATIGA